MAGRIRDLAMEIAIGVTAVFVATVPVTQDEAWAKGGGSVPAAERRALERTLSRAFGALPAPAKAFREDPTSGSREIAPGTRTEALQVRVYERPIGAGEDAETVGLEVRVYLNLERTLPEPLGSEGGTPETFAHEGLPGMRIGLAGVTPARVALPLSPDQEADALTVARLHVAAPEAKSYMEEIAKGRLPKQTPWDSKPARSSSEVRTIVVEFRGPRGEVERLVKETRAAPLRALLTP